MGCCILTNKIKIDSGRATILCFVDNGKGECEQYVDPDNFIYDKEDASGITPDKSFWIKRIQAEEKSVRTDDKKSVITISNLSKSQIKKLEELK